MEVYCVQVEYEGVYRADDYVAHTLYATLEGAKRGLRQERNEILRKPGWSEDSIIEDEDDHFYATGDEYYNESYLITINKEIVYD